MNPFQTISMPKLNYDNKFCNTDFEFEFVHKEVSATFQGGYIVSILFIFYC